eukprot:CAMPEP_0198206264 /NCGR_PEP_ID=MMETSP1445-20131203/9795_1 /TAXON_ID=36898 /ORGANISM="Pyramimonas sp., Strain CCMP2087" /LENGTH=376 /DNA_ID=CAMNT_0043878887 /DNA_START=253 /DNA_END=1379 /DNA_ORIENTATION=-
MAAVQQQVQQQQQQQQQLKQSFKTVEGRYRLTAERYPPTNGTNYRMARATRLTYANLRGAGDIDGPYLIYNVNDTLYISDANCIDKEPYKSITFPGLLPICHAYQQAADGNDLLIGFFSGEVAVVSLRQQLLEPSRKLIASATHNAGGCFNASRCTNVLWYPKEDGIFVSTHADGSMYVFDKNKEPSSDPSFPTPKDPSAFSISYPKSSKSNPLARWTVCSSAINAAAFSPDGVMLALGGRDGIVRVFNPSLGQLVMGARSYYGAVLSVGWSKDAKFIVMGGEDDLVTVFSLSERQIVAWGEGHCSWVSSVAFDPHWTRPPPSDPEDVADEYEDPGYRIVSVSQDSQLAFWEFTTDGVATPSNRIVMPVGSTAAEG